MGGLVEEQLTKALEALNQHDVDLANEVIDNDDKVNDFEINIDEACVKILAKRQPAASDLRLVSTVLKTITDLERIGDEAERIARVALESFNNDQQQFLVSLENLGQQVLAMLHGVLDAFARMDLDSAYEVHQMDAQAPLI